jgi:hypothetical protein
VGYELIEILKLKWTELKGHFERLFHELFFSGEMKSEETQRQENLASYESQQGGQSSSIKVSLSTAASQCFIFPN